MSQTSPTSESVRRWPRWLNRTVLGVGLASLFSDWAHEIATAVLPAFLATLGVGAVWLGLIEGISDGLSSAAKLASGYYTDRLRRRKPIAVAGYVVTACGTAAFGLATSAWHVLLARATAWFGRGIRTPVRKAILAGAVDKSTYGRAFGFERMMDTVGAIVGPLTALFLLGVFGHHYPSLFLMTLVPGLAAAGLMAFLVVEKERRPVPHLSFSASLRALPPRFRRYLLAVGLFGLGDFAHTMLILLAVERLTPLMGAKEAASVAIGLYVFRNILYAGFAYFGGWLADRHNKRVLLAGGYGLAGVMAMLLMSSSSPWTLPLVFFIAGVYIALEETLEDSLCAELVEPAQHGMAFGVLATVNGIGDFLSSIIVGALWSAFGARAAMSYSGILFVTGAILVWRMRRNSGVLDHD